MNKYTVFSILIATLSVTACSPTVAVKAPEEPITINMNIKIEHEVRIRVDRELDDVFAEDSGLF